MAHQVPLKKLGVDPKQVWERVKASEITAEVATALIAADPLLDYAVMIAEIMDKPSDPRSGMSGEDVRKYCAVINKVKAASPAPCVILEDSDYAALIAKLNAYCGWSRSHNNVVTFIDDMKNAEKVDLNAAQKPAVAPALAPESNRQTAAPLANGHADQPHPSAPTG